MSVTDFSEVLEMQSGNYSLERGRREFTRVFRATCTSIADNQYTVITYAAGAIPLASALPGDTGCRLTKISAVPDQKFQLTWLVTLTYDSVLCAPESQGTSPTARNPKWTFGNSKYTKAIAYDFFGKAIVNSACVPFNPPYEIEVSRPTIDILVNKSSFSFSYLTSIQNSINDATWNGFPAWTVKVDTATATQNWENNVQFWELHYALLIEWEKWMPVRILDQGLTVRKDCAPSSSSSSSGSSSSSSSDTGEVFPSLPVSANCCAGDLVILRDKWGVPFTEPQLLCGGYVSDTPCWLDFYPFRAMDFSGIP